MATLPLSSVLRSHYIGRGTAESSKVVACTRCYSSERIICCLRKVDAVENQLYQKSQNFAPKIFSKPRGLSVVSAVGADASVIQTATQVSKYLFRTNSGGLVKVFVEPRSSKFGVKIQVLPSELDNRHDQLVLVWGIFRSDAKSFMSLDSRCSEQNTIETVLQPKLKSSGELEVQLDFESSLAPFYISFYLKSKLISEIKSHRNTNFVVPVGFSSGDPAPLGLSFRSDGSVNFAVVSRSAESVVLCLYNDMRSEKPAVELDLDPYVNRSGDIWHASIDSSSPFVGYGYRIKGVTEHVLLDPYSKIITDYIRPIKESVSLPRCLGQVCKEPAFDWGNDVRPNIPMEKLIVYHLNVSNFTKHKSSKLPSHIEGTFSGVTEKLHHFKDLGVNAILLEPIFPFDEQKGPYFPFHFFSPGPSSVINSMKQMVKKLHSTGIEVFLQVVFTHTAEGAPLLYIDKSSYYRLEDDHQSRNSLNCNYPLVQQMILEGLRHWVVEYHVDGFCFVNASSLTKGFHGEPLSRPPLVEAIAFDPLLSNVKLIADFWDSLEKTSTEVGFFPHWKRWAEINSKFCGDVRNFLRGNGSISDLATRLCGSGDAFSGGRGPAFSFNYITRNFGLSLVDLVSFSSREVASELSWNCGEEGPTKKGVVLERRLKQIRNFLFVLFISLGVPVLHMGDECGRSSGGSPAYDAQKPFDWNALKTCFGIQTVQFISFLSELRSRRSDLLQKKNFLDEESIEWHGSDRSPPVWVDPSNKFLAMTLKSNAGSDLRGPLFAAFNSSDRSEIFVLPPPPSDMAWYRLVDTSLPFPGVFSEKGTLVEDDGSASATYEMKSYSCVLFEAKDRPNE